MELNSEQKKAVEHSGGPLMVVAGAGTGKTRVIIHRIAWLVTAAGVNRENILALTYTKKAAGEMQERLQVLLNTPFTGNLVSTIHSFCHTLLLEFGSRIGLPRELPVLDDTEAKIILRKLLPRVKPVYYLHHYDPRTTIDEIFAFISRAKHELTSPRDYAEYVRSQKQAFPRSAHGLSAEKREEQENLLQRREESAEIYRVYQEELLARGVIDYGDQIMLAHRLFREHPEVVERVSRRYKHILVDEFQDTNTAQIRVLHLLAQPGSTICVVGDDDQSIYRFRSASYASFDSFTTLFPAYTEVMLQENYRSTKTILDCSALSIQNNADFRLFPDKRLFTKNPPGVPAAILRSHSTEQEARSVAGLLEAQLERNSATGEYESIAVLYRAHRHAKLLLNECLRRRIPYKILVSEPLFLHPDVKMIIAYMRVLDFSDDHSHFYTLLRHPAWKLTEEDITDLFTYMQMSDCTPLEMVINGAFEEVLTPQAAAGAARLKETMIELKDAAPRLTAIELLQLIIKNSPGVLNRLRNPSHGNDTAFNNVVMFYNFVFKNCEDKAEQSLRSFLDFLDDYILAGGDPGRDEMHEPDPSSINFLTVHAAKGLEFDTVYVISLANGRFPSRFRQEKLPFPRELMKAGNPDDDEKTLHLLEERRLFYVAMTRARKKLVLSCLEMKRTRISRFVQEILDNPRSASLTQEIQSEELISDEQSA